MREALDVAVEALELAGDVRWQELARGAEFTVIDRQMLGEMYERAREAISRIASLSERGEGEGGSSQGFAPSADAGTPAPRSPEGSEGEREDPDALADFIRDQVCCPRRVGGCEIDCYPESCPAERVRRALKAISTTLGGVR